MKKREIDNKEEVICYLKKEIDNLQCSLKCFKRTIKYTITIGLLSMLAFAVGFFSQPYITRAIWLIITGVLTVLSGIVLFFLLTKPRSYQNEFNCMDL